jgi:murein DD-endopeptidase MepM/ murein hydrolase activator NlpD
MGAMQALLAAVLAPLMSVSLLVPVPPSAVPADVAQLAAPHARATKNADEPRRFWVRDKRRYASPWYAGRHRKMIEFGCTRAPYYSPDPRCRKRRGFHHGLDIAMSCGTRLFAGVAGRVVRPGSSGSLGTAYGKRAFRIRNHRRGVDVVIGHVRKVYVAPGDRVRRGQRIARASDAAAPDGCHLHLEVRPAGAGYRDAVRPHRIAQLS